MATGLHGGLLFAFADQIGATSNSKIQTEISILDLPSVSGTAKFDAKPLNRIQPKSDSRLGPVEKKNTNRLENSSENLIAKSADNNAELIKKVNKRTVADAIKEASSIQPISSPKLANNLVSNIANSTAPIENKHQTTVSITSARISKTNSPAKIVTESQEYNIAMLTSPSKAHFNQKKTTVNLEPTQSAQTIKRINSDNIAKLAPARKAKRAQTASIKLKVSKSIPPAKQARKITPASISKSNRPELIEALAHEESSKTEFVISTSKKLRAVKAKPSIPVENSKKTVKQMLPKLRSSKLVSHIRIGRIKTVNSNANRNQTSSISSSIKVAILARPRQIVTKALSKPADNQVDNFAKVVNFLKFYNSDNPCFLALPSISSQENLVLSGFSNEKSSWPRFQKALVKNTKLETSGRLASISDAQCQVIRFARQSNSYPSYSVSLLLDYSNIKNGEFIAGKIFFDEGQYLNLLLVDDEGTAININRFVDIEKNNSAFQLQVNLTGGEVSTSQLLLAIVTDMTLDSMQSLEAIAATELLNNIKKEVDARNIHMDLALSAFVVK